MTKNLVSFGQFIRRQREKLGLTQAQLAARVGRAQVTVSEWERGVAQPSDLRALADALEMELDALGHALKAAFIANDDVEEALQRQTLLTQKEIDALILIYRGLLAGKVN
ncbi:helix-turn-helix domain-containing protein [Alloactinosynnema sp. L-07]|uniref:helix-turn-helix domain-containing protein n=1 Tax=Alloactinosynnema sp. L-07 TaxID=1653480 RepID=UPI0006B40034|nr:helix-turn-helix transcriptional regulator [Alloactinosynnema sp. L-07]